MNISSLAGTLAAVNANQVTSETLSKPLNATFDKILNVLTFGIYGSYKNSAAAEMKNDMLDIGAALIKWDPETPEIPLSLTLQDRDYEICDMPHGGIRLVDCASGESKEFENVSLTSMRDMIFFDLMTQPDFSEAMDNMVVRNFYYSRRYIGYQAGAGKRLRRRQQRHDSRLPWVGLCPGY